MADITDTQLDSLMKKAQSTLRKALHASTSLSTDTIYQDVENNGLGLQNLKLEMSIRLIVNFQLRQTTGSAAIQESLSAAIGLPGFFNEHNDPVHLFGPFEFTYLHKNEEKTNVIYTKQETNTFLTKESSNHKTQFQN
jgi:hypothetical protein